MPNDLTQEKQPFDFSKYQPYKQQEDVEQQPTEQPQPKAKEVKPADLSKYQPYEIPEFEGSYTLEGVKSGLRSSATFIPKVGKITEQINEKPFEKRSTGQKAYSLALESFPATKAFLSGASLVYDMKPEFFGKTHAEAKMAEGKPLPKEVTESTRFRVGEFFGMDLPFIGFDLATAGGSKILRHGVIQTAKFGLKRLAQKEAYIRGANLVAGQTIRPALAGTLSRTLQDNGVPEWAANVISIPFGYYAIPKAVDKAGIYVLEKTTESLLKKQAKASSLGITPTFANTGEGATSELALGILQKDFSSRNIMKESIAKQDKEFGDSILTIVNADKSIVDEAENFLTDVLESNQGILSKEEESLAAQQAKLGETTEALETEQKAVKTKQQENQEAAQQLQEDETPIPKPNTQAERVKITEQATATLPDKYLDVSDRLIQDAEKNIKANAETVEDQKAVQLVQDIPVTKMASENAMESIYESISPRIGQADAGKIYKDKRAEAYKIATVEKRNLYQDLEKKTRASKHVIPFADFERLTKDLTNMIENLQSLTFRSPRQDRALDQLIKLYQSFDRPNESFGFGDDVVPVKDAPDLLKLWEIRKSLGQSINWSSNAPGEKILKSRYENFNKVLDKNLKSAGLLELYNNANQVYIERFLPLEQGSNGKVKYMSDENAGKVLNLEAINGLEQYVDIQNLNPLRRHALEKQVGHPKPGNLNYREVQKFQNVNKYLTPNEQAQFHSLTNMPLIQAKVATNQLGYIENFIEKNRDKLSPNVLKQLEKVTGELRSRADLPVEYITGRAQLAELERISEEQYISDVQQQKKDRTQLKRDLRQEKAQTQQQLESIKEQQQAIANQSKDISAKQKTTRREQAKLQKSLLNTMLQQDTNTAMLNKMSTIDGIKAVQDLLGDSAQGKRIFQGLKQLKAQQIFENATSVNAVAKLMNSESSKNLLQKLLLPEQYKKLDDLSRLAQNVQERLRYYVNNSNTEVQRAHSQHFFDLAKGIVASLTYQSAELAGRTLFKFLVLPAWKRSLARFLTDPKGIQYSIDFFKALKSSPSDKKTFEKADRFKKYLIKTGYITETSEESDK